MSKGLDYLHSHSALEREIGMHNSMVLIDEKFGSQFLSETIQPFVYNGVKYYKVPTISFVLRKGVFKNLKQ